LFLRLVAVEDVSEHACKGWRLGHVGSRGDIQLTSCVLEEGGSLAGVATKDLFGGVHLFV